MKLFKLTFLFFSILFSSVLSAQMTSSEVLGKVSYLKVISFPGEEVHEKEFDFYFSQNEGLFILKNDDEKAIGQGLEPEVTETDRGTNLKFDFSAKHRWPLHTSLTTKEIKREVVLFSRGKNREYIVTEAQFPVRWKLLDEEKLIGNVLCRKASGFFRGRDYTAWYAPEIPVRLGPWKFEGLPGLILEIYDDRKQVFFSATSINIPATGAKLPATWLSSGKKVSEITLQECLDIETQQIEEAHQAILARLPRGSVFEMEEKESNKIETSYEFDRK